MCHKLDYKIFSNRVFPVLVVTADVSTDRFLVIQVPVELDADSGYYSAGRNAGNDAHEAEQQKRHILGKYASIEICERNPETDEVTWQMSTASDANMPFKIPHQLVRNGVLDSILKDVGYFMKWCRVKRGQPT